MDRKFHIEGVGYINMVKKRRLRRLKISIRPFEGVQVSIPDGVSYHTAEKFVLQKKDWIGKGVKKIQQIERDHTLFTFDGDFATRFHRLKILQHEEKTIRIVIKNSMIHFFFPENASIEDSRVQNAIRHAVEEAWRIEARNYLPRRTRELAVKHGFSFRRVTVKNAKTRWGSCSQQNNINLNLQLMRLPEELCDYIILHELAHTVQKNHGKKFWQLLDRITDGKAKVLDRKMKDYHLRVW